MKNNLRKKCMHAYGRHTGDDPARLADLVHDHGGALEAGEGCKHIVASIRLVFAQLSHCINRKGTIMLMNNVVKLNSESHQK